MSTSMGGIRLYRDVMNNAVWNDKPYNKGCAWVDLLMLANYKDNDVLIGNQIIRVKRGSFITSYDTLSKRWGWGNKKVRAFLGMLEGANMVTRESTTKCTTVTIVNYDVHQVQGQTKGTTKDTTKGSICDTTEDKRRTNKGQQLIKDNKRIIKENEKATDHFRFTVLE